MRQAVLFDMDGVLCDSEAIINAAAIAYFRERGVTVQPEDFHPFVGAGENRYIGGVAEQYGVALEIEAAKARVYELYLELVPDHLQAFPGVHELVDALAARGARLALASAADRLKVDANLREIGLPPERFGAVVTGEMVARRKPAPDVFLAAAAALGVAPADCVVVEDAVNGVQAARAAGMACVAVATSFPAARLTAADRVVSHLTELSAESLLAG